MKGFNKTLPELWLRPELAGQEQVAGSSRQAGRQAGSSTLPAWTRLTPGLGQGLTLEGVDDSVAVIANTQQTGFFRVNYDQVLSKSRLQT